MSKRIVLQRLIALSEFFDVQMVGYDRWRFEDLIALAEDEGLDLPEIVPFGQGYGSISPALDRFEEMLLNGEIAHPGHPVLNWCASNAVVVMDDAGNRKLSKEKAIGRIDLMLAAVMAVGVMKPNKGDADGFFRNPIMVGI